MRLTNKDKKFLLSIGYTAEDFQQIEDAMSKSTFAIFKEGEIDQCGVIDYQLAKEYLGKENLISALARSAFHFSTSREIPHTFGKYNISIDSGVILTGKPSKLLEKNNNHFNLKEIDEIFHIPNIRIFNIQWDISDEEYEYEDEDLPEEIIIPLENVSKYIKNLDSIADYISDNTGFCHYGYEIEFNYTIEELYKIIEDIDKDIDSKYENAKPSFISELEDIKTEIELFISLIEEYEEEMVLN